ncbi:Gluconate 5-dehydrogenase [bacterium HR11]|nr:Gluconate 5-dehydrogenase [bacterium HR11]
MHVQALFDLTGQVALVTGGSRGLGRAMAEGLAEAGARVFIVARRREWLDETEQALTARGLACEALAADVGDPSQVETVVRTVLEKAGRVDVLVNAHGVAWGAPSLEMPLERWEWVLRTNLTGTFLTCQAVGRHMIRQGSGSIVNVASVAGWIGMPEDVLAAVGYTASKGGIIALSRDLAVKWAPYGVRVNVIAPGFFETRMTRGVLEQAGDRIRSTIPMGRVGQPEDLKGVAVFLASPAARYVTGHVLVVDGGLTAG